MPVTTVPDRPQPGAALARALGLALSLALLLAALVPPLAAAPQGAADEGLQEEALDEEAAAPPPPADPTMVRQEIALLEGQLQRLVAEGEAVAAPSVELREIILEALDVLGAAKGVSGATPLPQLEITRDRLLSSSNQLYETLRASRDEEGRLTARPRPRQLPPEPAPTPAQPAQPPGEKTTPPPAGPASTGPPAELRAAARAFFAGRYGEVLTLLADADFTEPRATAHALLLSAAARYNLYQLSGDDDPMPLDIARGELEECRRLAPGLTPDPEVFSPRFVRFFQGG